MIAIVEALQPRAFLLQREEEALEHSVLLGTVRRNVLLLEPVAAHDRDEDLRAEDEAVVGAQRERVVALGNIPLAYRVFQRRRGDVGNAGAREAPAHDRAVAAVND